MIKTIMIRGQTSLARLFWQHKELSSRINLYISELPLMIEKRNRLGRELQEWAEKNRKRKK